MHNESLAADYLKRARARLLAVEVLAREQSWPDVVRESQEAVEILLKALLRSARIEVPRVHDVSPLLDDNRERLPESVRGDVDELIRISKDLRRDRELAFYGSEDLTPSQFYNRDDAERALEEARRVLDVVARGMG